MNKEVKSVRIFLSKHEDHPGYEKMYREYNEKAQLILEIEYGDDSDDPVAETAFKYDENGNETEKTITYSEDEWIRYIKEWDDKNRLKSSKTVYPNGTVEHHRTYAWNDQETELTVSLLDAEENIIGEEVQIYNEHKNIVEEQYYDEEGNLAEKYLYKYNGDNRLIEKIEELGGFENHFEYQYELDSQNRLTEMRVVDEEGETSVTRIEFHENGKKSSEEQVLTTGASEILHFDEEEKIISEEKYDETHFKIQDGHYFYDDSGQLIRKHVLNDGKYFRVDYEYELFGEISEEEE